MSSKNCPRCGHLASEDALFCPRCGNSLKGAAANPLVGTVVADRYLLVEKIGQGNSGTIYRGEHTTLRKKVAVKVLHHELSKDEGAMERFRREATTVGEIDNEHIAQVLDFGRTSDGRLFFAMEYLEGETLADAIQGGKQLPVTRAVSIASQIGEALMEAHAVGFIHRDLRPRNVMLTKKRGKSDFVKLLDFGLSKLLLPSDMKPGQTAVLTTSDPRYLAPELLRGEAADRRSDIYALGAILFEMLAGKAPYEGTTAPALLARLESKQPTVRDLRGDVPEWLDRVVQTAMARPIDKRFVTVLKMHECLDGATAPGADAIVDQAAEKRAAEEPGDKGRREAESQRVAERAAHAADDKRAAEEKARRVADDKRAAEEKRVAAEKREADEKRVAAEKREADEKRVAAEKREADEKRVAAEKREADEKRVAEEKAKREAEEKRLAEERAAAEKRAADERAAAQRALAHAGVAKPSPATAVQMAQSGNGKKSKRQQKQERLQQDRPRDPAARAGSSSPAGATLVMPTVAPAPAAPATMVTASGEGASDRPSPKADQGPKVELAPDLIPIPRDEARPANGSGKHPRIVFGETGEHERVWFADGSSPKPLVDAEHFDDDHKRKIAPATWGLGAAGLIVVSVLGIALWPRGPKKEEEQRDYNRAAISESVKNKTPEPSAAAEVAPAAKVPEPVAANPAPSAPVAVAEPVAAKPAEPANDVAALANALATAKAPEEPALPAAREPETKAAASAAIAAEKKATAPTSKEPERKDADKKPEIVKKVDPAKKGLENFRDPFSADATKQAAQSADLLLKAGRQKLNAGDFASAMSDFKKAKDLDSRSSDAIAGLGECAFELGDYDQAATQLKAALRISKRARYSVLLGQAYYKLGNFQGAFDECSKVMRADGANQEAKNCFLAAQRKLGK